MADLATIRIPVDSSDMVQAVREAKNLERGINMLVDALGSGAIGANQYNAGLRQLQKEFKNLFDNYQQATAAVRGHAKSLQESAVAAKQAASAKNDLAMATKKAETAFALANQKAKEELQTLRNRAEFAFAMAMQREQESQKAVQAAERQAQAEAKLTAEILRRRQAQEASASSSAAASQAQIGQNLGLGARGISAAASASAMEAEIERLRQKYDKIYASSQLYEASLKELNQAHLLGVTSTKQHEEAVERLNAEYQAFQNGTATVYNRFAQGVQQTGEGLNNAGVLMQQLGYQAGDFIVQVQSGTNAFVAFGQQATQLVGFLPMLAAEAGVAKIAFMGLNISMASLTLGLSIIIPLLTAAGALWMRTSESSDQAAKSVDKQAEAYKNLISRLEELQLKRQMEASGAQSQDEQIILNEINSLLEQQADIRDRLFKLQSAGGRAAGYAEQKKNEADLLQAALDKNQAIIDGLVAERVETERINRLNQIRTNQVLEELAARQHLKQAHADQVQAMGEARNEQRLMTIAAQEALDKYSMMRTVAAGLADEMARTAANTRAAAEAALSAMRIEFSPSGRTMSQYGGRGTTSDRPITDQFGNVIVFPGSQRPRRRPNDIDFGLPDFNRASGGARKLKDSFEEADKAAEKLRNELDGPLKSAVGSVADAFGDFMARGLTDFKGFVQDILKSFQNMIAQMIAMAVKNRIMLSLGIGGITPQMAAAGQVAGLGSAGGLLGSLGIGKGIGGLAGGTGFLGGLGNTIAGLGGGGAGFFGIGANAAAAGGGVLSTIGAAIPVLGAVASVFGLLRKKTKELDSGLRITVGNMDALVKTFTTTETKRFFGLSKKVSTSVSEASSEISDPIVKAVQDIQGQIIKAAGAFGFAEDTFKDFLYNFEVSLKGLSEDQKIQKVNEELAKMGDSFAALTGHFSTMNELLEAANQRMELQNRLDTLLGNNQAVLQRQREAEIAATHELNRPLLTAIYTLEDAQSAVTSAFAALRASIDKTVEDLQKKLSVANEAVARSRGIFQQLESALSGRYLRGSDSQFSMRRQGALGFLRRGDFSDERQLEEALGVVAEPSEDLFKSFEDYARDFYFTSGIIEEAKNLAQTQLTADEKQVALLEKQIADAQSQYDLMMQQYNELMGINTNLLSVEEAVIGVQEAIRVLAEAMKMASAIKASGGVAGSSFREAFGTGEKYQGFDLAKLSGANDLLQAAKMVGIGTTGKTGAEIQQELSNATGLAINMDNATRAQRFAMGGMHSGGLRIVGEQGPELESTGPARIFSHRQTAEMFRDPDLANSVVELKNEVSRMRSEQLQIQLEISKNTKRIYDTERKWDVEGLPPERV